MSADDFEKKQMNLKVTLDLDNQLTWGELYKFVDLARSSGYDEFQPVAIEYNENMEPEGFVIYLTPDEVGPPSVASPAVPVTPRVDDYNPAN